MIFIDMKKNSALSIIEFIIVPVNLEFEVYQFHDYI